MGRVLAVVVVAVVVVSLPSCSDSSEPSTTISAATTPAEVTTTTVPPTTAATPPSTVPATTSTAAGVAGPSPTIPTYTIGARVRAEGGDTVVVVLPSGPYSDTDLEDITVDAMQRFAPIATLHVVDDDGAVPLVLAPPADLTAADASELEVHYLARLEEGFRLVFLGPLTEVDAVIIGS